MRMERKGEQNLGGERKRKVNENIDRDMKE